MNRFALFIIALFLSSPASAGDYLEDFYFYIVASVPAEVSYSEQADFVKPSFQETINRLSDEWTQKCGVRVDFWYTNLMDHDENSWTPDYWFGFVSAEPSKEEAIAFAPDSECTRNGYLKIGNMVIPSSYYYCSAGDDGSQYYQDLCPQ